MNICEDIPGIEGEANVIEEVIPSVIYFDGFATVGGGGIGIVISDQKSQPLIASCKLDFPCTNNIVEYEAYVIGLLMAKERGVQHLEVRGDSNLVVCQVLGDFALKEPSLAPYRTKARDIEKTFTTFQIRHIQRNENKYADSLATLGSRFSFLG